MLLRHLWPNHNLAELILHGQLRQGGRAAGYHTRGHGDSFRRNCVLSGTIALYVLLLQLFVATAMPIAAFDSSTHATCFECGSRLEIMILKVLLSYLRSSGRKRSRRVSSAVHQTVLSNADTDPLHGPL